MKRLADIRPDASWAPRPGFTLAELLVTITIILILSGISLRALVVAQEYARADKTRATIAKINHEIMAMYESYPMRKLPARLPTTGNLIQQGGWRLDALRDLMRLEMPDRWSDVVYLPDPTTDPAANRGRPNTFGWSSPQPWYNDGSGNPRYPALTRAYQRRYTAAFNRGIPVATLLANESAECLYLIVTQHNAEAREHFLDNEVGDTDADGLYEFLDGWNRPIAFLRWAPTFDDSDLQRAVLNRDGTENAALRNNAVQTDHDPLDTRRTDPYAFRLLPLIYSAGPDGQYGIQTGATNTTYGSAPAVRAYNGSPYTDVYSNFEDPFQNRTLSDVGRRTTDDSRLDNIHNHRSGTM